MHIVALTWMFIVLLMALVEATSTQGTVLGALVTLLLYGVLPLSVVLYLMATPTRRKRRREARAAAQAHTRSAASGAAGDGRGHAAGDGAAPEREEA